MKRLSKEDGALAAIAVASLAAIALIQWRWA